MAGQNPVPGMIGAIVGLVAAMPIQQTLAAARQNRDSNQLYQMLQETITEANRRINAANNHIKKLKKSHADEIAAKDEYIYDLEMRLRQLSE